jgi:hypothetical protein
MNKYLPTKYLSYEKSKRLAELGYKPKNQKAI